MKKIFYRIKSLGIKLPVLVFLAIVISFLFLSCGKEEHKDELVIGGLIRYTDDFLTIYTDNLKLRAEEYNVKLELFDAENNPSKQLKQLDDMLSRGIKHFVIAPVESKITEEMTKKIKEKGGSAAFSNIQPTEKALRVGKNFFLASSSELDAGKIQADIIDEYFKKYPNKLKQGNKINALVLLGEMGHPAQVLRTKAVIDSLKQKNYKIEILAQDSGNWNYTKAKHIMDDWLKQYQDKFNLVISNNDSMALGAVESLLSNRYTDNPSDPLEDVDGDGTVLKVPVIGVDATPVALLSMKEHKLYATVLQDAKGQSDAAFDLVYSVAKKGGAIDIKAGEFESAKEIIPNEPLLSNKDLLEQCYIIPFKPVTKDNYKKIIMDACKGH